MNSASVQERKWTARRDGRRWLREFSRTLAVVLVLLVCFSGSVDARYCWSTTCAMCNRIFGTLPGYGPPGHTPSSTTTTGGAGGLFSIYEPTPQAAVDLMLDQLDLGPDDVLYDLGAGDGRLLIAAVKRFKCRGVGIEINPEIAALARRRIRLAGCQRVRIVVGDARKFHLDQADAVVMYLFPDLMAQFVPKINCPIVSYSHRIPGRSCKKVESNGYQVYVARTRMINLRLQ